VAGVLWRLVVAHTGVVLFLVPADPLRFRRADQHFAAEAGQGGSPVLAPVTPAAAWMAGVAECVPA
jgi:hypothetical protein